MSDRGALDGEFAGFIESTALLQTAMDRLNMVDKRSALAHSQAPAEQA